MTFSETVGWIGMIIVLAAYLLALCRKDYSEGAPYFLLNLLGAILIGIDVFYRGVWSLVILECIWGGGALVRLVKKLFQSRSFRREK